MNDGESVGSFKCQYVISGRWIVDIFFPDVRLAIDIIRATDDAEDQRELDRRKDADCARFDITLLRITGREVFGDPEELIARIEAGWRKAMNRENRIIGMDADEYFSRRGDASSTSPRQAERR